MKLVEEFSYIATLAPPQEIGQVPTGNRMIIGVTGGEIKGERLNGKILPGGGEWALIRSDGCLNVDVRFQAETNDGALLYFQYYGIIVMNEKFQTAMGNAEGTEFSDQYFMTNPRIETGDERYAWLNQTFFIGQGRLVPGFAVEYKVFRPE